eukprot:4546915-Prymnesium_polylepis.1
MVSTLSACAAGPCVRYRRFARVTTNRRHPCGSYSSYCSKLQSPDPAVCSTHGALSVPSVLLPPRQPSPSIALQE